MVKAIGLDGREVDDEPETVIPVSGQDESDMAAFDALPPYAREALRKSNFTFKARDTLPHVRSGLVNRFNFDPIQRDNEGKARAYYQEQDRKNGLA